MKLIYTYVYFVDEVPEYVGKGTEKRFLYHVNPIRPSHKPTLWHNHVTKAIKDKRNVRVVLHPKATHEDALDAEIALIALYGRRDLGTGTLYNLTDGGDGQTGGGWTQSVATRSKISAYVRNRPESVLERMRASARNRPPESAETKARKSAAQKARWAAQKGLPV